MKTNESKEDKVWFKLFRYVDLQGIDNFYNQLPEARKNVTLTELDSQKAGFNISLSGVLKLMIEGKIGGNKEKETTKTTITKEIETYERKIGTLITHAHSSDAVDIRNYITNHPNIGERILVVGSFYGIRLSHYLSKQEEDNYITDILRKIRGQKSNDSTNSESYEEKKQEYVDKNRGLNIYVAEVGDAIIIFPMSVEKRIAVASADLFAGESTEAVYFLGYIHKPIERVYHIKPLATWQQCTSDVFGFRTSFI